MIALMYHNIIPESDPHFSNCFEKHKVISASITLTEFESHIRYLKRNYQILDPIKLMDHIEKEEPTPENSVILTFDDGFFNHYKYVYPLLKKYGLTGMFFPSRSTIKMNAIPSQYKFILLMTFVSETIVFNELKDIIELELSNWKIHKAFDELFAFYSISLHKKNNTWSEKQVFISRFLREAINQDQSDAVYDKLLKSLISIDEVKLLSEIFMSEEQAREMINDGMHFGGHGDKHHLCKLLDETGISSEINGAIDMLDAIYDHESHPLFYCYPHGSYNRKTLELLRAKNCALAFATNPDSLNDYPINKMEISRKSEKYISRLISQE